MIKKQFKSHILLYILIISFSNCTKTSNKEEANINYPVLKYSSVSDTYFGEKVDDKYRFLETDSSNSINKWIADQNTLTDSLLNKYPFRDSLKKILEDVIFSSKIRGGFPRVIDKKMFFTRIYLEEKIQKIFYKDSLNGKDIELFSTISVNDSVQKFNIDYFEPSFDGKYIAFGLSSNINDINNMRFIDVDKKILLPEKIERTSYGFPSWIPETHDLFYSQLKEIKSEADYNTMYENSQVKLHKINSAPEHDKIIFSQKTNTDLPLNNLDFSSISAFPSSDKFIAFVERGSTANMSLYCALKKDVLTQKNGQLGIWKKIYSEEQEITNFTLHGNDLYTLSFGSNPNGILKKCDLNSINYKEEIIIEATDEVLDDMIQTENSLYIKKIKNGISSIIQINLQTGKKNIVELPFEGYVYLKPVFGIATNYSKSKDLFFGMESWNKELGIYTYNFHSEKIFKTELRKQGKYGNLKDVVIKEIEISSHDGTKVPLSIIYYKNIKLDGKNPTLIEGYGAYGISMNSTFYLPILPWLKMGGVYAVAHVRGGGEKGESWHKAGCKSTKSNSWKDFIACAEYLIKENYTSPQKLAARGGSAGGITIGRAIIERPEIFKAAILEVSELNTIRSENSRNTFGSSEFGTVKDSLGFKYLYEMDVYHHIKDEIKYPSILLTAGLNDTRVDWWQPAKAAARFQEVSASKSNAILFKINTTGHSGEEDKVKEETDYYSFLLWQLNHNPSNFNMSSNK